MVTLEELKYVAVALMEKCNSAFETNDGQMMLYSLVRHMQGQWKSPAAMERIVDAGLVPVLQQLSQSEHLEWYAPAARSALLLGVVYMPRSSNLACGYLAA